MSSTQGEIARRTGLVLGLVSICLSALLGLSVASASAAPKPDYPKAFSPVDGEVTYDGNEADLQAKCPEGIAATPGSDPASKYIDFALSDLESGEIHYVYDDNNARTDEDFEVQDCVVVYPEDFFTAEDFDDDGTFDGDLSKHDLTKGGEVLDQATLEGSDESTAPIHFTWQAPDDLVGGDWVCNFARDVNNQHQGGGNRKVPPTCYQVPDDPETETRFVTPADPSIDRGSCRNPDTYTIPTKLHITYLVGGEPVEAGDYDLDEGETVVITVEVEEGYTLTAPPGEGERTWSWTFTGSDQGSCGGGGGGGGGTTTTTSTTLAPQAEPQELAFTPEPEVLPEVITTTTAAPVLPFTGAGDNVRLATVALALATLGSALVLGSRRRPVEVVED